MTVVRPDEPVAPLAVFSHGELIGDAMVKIPFLRGLRALFPDRRIVWITTEETHLETTLAPLIAGTIDEFRSNTGIGTSPLELLKPLPERQRFSLVIDTQTLWWRTLIARRFRHDLFVSPCASYRFSERKPPPDRRRPRHLMDRLFGLLEVAAERPPPVEPLRDGVPTPPDAAAEARALLPDGATYIALAPGAGKRHKCWPLDRYIALGREQAVRGRVPVFILGPGETEWMPALREALPTALFPLQDGRVGEPRYTPVRTIALTRRCAAAVANDSGISKMFAVADIPLVTLYGPTDGDKVHPKVTAGTYLTAQRFGGTAMELIPIAAVDGAIESLITTGHTD